MWSCKCGTAQPAWGQNVTTDPPHVALQVTNPLPAPQVTVTGYRMGHKGSTWGFGNLRYSSGLILARESHEERLGTDFVARKVPWSLLDLVMTPAG